ncbi:unnamed protein product [Thlaspi arvense]|uniref:At2g35280-like TPR domain-containing protein n=1 Tax=Thlaspi arvense TaxID=13288 RepID=A0AAU9SSQ7_THLAR|nr:unnamed protein product [Thlaspi arvense]
MADKNTTITLSDLPEDIVGEILARVGSSSRRQLRHVMEASKALAKAANDKGVYKALNLRPLVFHPLATRYRYKDLMEKTLTNGNIEAHYIKGILEYFHKNNTITGLQHLKLAARGSYSEGMHLYGIILLSRGEMEEGKAYLDQLGWQHSKTRGDRCWRNIKKSLHGVRVLRLPAYRETIRVMKPTIMCNLNDLENRCHHCYYYKQIVKFVFVI